jgi:hypothetical protein
MGGMTDNLDSVQEGLSFAYSSKKLSDFFDEWLKSFGAFAAPISAILKNTGLYVLLDKADGPLKGFFIGMIENISLGLSDKFTGHHQKEEQTAVVAQIKTHADQFTAVASALHLDAKFAAQLQDDCNRAALSNFGALGMSDDNATLVPEFMTLQETLEKDIQKALLIKYHDIGDDPAKKIARESAAALTGLDLNDLKKTHPEERLQGNLPTNGFGGLLLSARDGLATGATPREFKINTTALNLAVADVEAIQHPTGTPPAPPSSIDGPGT